MPSRIATDPAGQPDGLKALVLADPGIIEQGFRVLDFDLLAGSSGSIDVLGIDRAGSLAILAVAEGDPGEALMRLLDQYSWASDQRDLLRRLYAPNGLAAGSRVRCLLLASSFTHAFLRRLSLLAVEVTPYLVRCLPSRGDSAALIEPAGPIFGLETAGDRVSEAERRGGAIAGVATPAQTLQSAEDDSEDGRETWPVESGQDRRVDLLPDLSELVLPRSVEPPPEEIDPAAAFENLTADELEEFQRFDRQRRERDRRVT